MSRYHLGPVCGGDPPYCFVLDEIGRPLGLVFGPNIVVAEDNARTWVDKLNDPGLPVYVEVIEPRAEAEIIPIGKGVRR